MSAKQPGADWQSETTPGALVEVNVAGRRYPLVVRPDCRTCRSPNRLEIEHRLMSGASYDSVAVWAAEQEPGELPQPGTNSLRSHAKTHMGVAGASWRGLIDRRIKELVESDADDGADGVAMARTIVRVAMEGLADGTVTPTAGDALNAAKFLAVYDAADTGPDIDAWRQALMAYMEVAQAFIPADRWGAFAAALGRNPVLRQLAAASTDIDRQLT